ncbi:SHOCT domain-containing protein [Nitratireductor sp. ZSWI3]|uniref:SHOCT domain-containing protein n=1 Tax=Nitratireductor sp. ZSWI3 TaxID=2966359 RepID=UPI0021500605|nr:SHOCT domain-containing protein [Nitratireductor sp. ZSWI3]MCR4266839.1 SHOCT domain-containing protein [Nitratireductor sp. ZSWI3]
MTQTPISIAALTGIATTLLPAHAWSQASPDFERYGWGPHMMGWGGGWFGMIFGPIFMILVLALVIAFAVLLVRWLGGSWHSFAPYPPPSARTPLDLLKERFARGEIDKEDFEERRRILGE